YADHRGISRPAVNAAARDGRIPTHDGKIDVEEADAAWEQNTGPPRKRGGGRPSGAAVPNGLPSLATSNAMRVAWLARLARLEYERRAGQVVEVAVVKRQAFDAARRARDLL